MIPYFLRTGKNAKLPYFARCVARELLVPPALFDALPPEEPVKSPMISATATLFQ